MALKGTVRNSEADADGHTKDLSNIFCPLGSAMLEAEEGENS